MDSEDHTGDQANVVSGIQNVQPFMHSIAESSLNTAQRGIVASMRALESEWTAQTTPAELKESMAETFPPSVLFSPDVALMPVIYREIRKRPDRFGAMLGVHSTRRIPTLLADRLYQPGPEQDMAMELATNIIHGRVRGSVSAEGAADTSVGSGAAGTASTAYAVSTPYDRLSYNISQRYRDAASKFSGEPDQVWPEFVQDYLLMARDNHLSVEQRYQYLHYVLAGDAKRFYLNTVQGHDTSFTEAVAMIEAEYNSAAKQMQVKNTLSNHKLSAMVTAGKDIKTALADTYKMIVRLSPLVPQAYRSDANKLDFLRSAVVGYPWANSSLRKLNAGNITFQQLYTDLQSSLQLHEEASEAAVANGIQVPTAAVNYVPRALNADVLYAGRGVYGRPNRNVGATQPRVQAPSQVQRVGPAPSLRFDPLTISGCFNCDNPGHTMRDCRAPVNTTLAAKRKMEYWSKKHAGKPVGAAILFQLCRQLDALVGPDGELHSTSNPPDIQLLEEDGDEATLFRTWAAEVKKSTEPSGQPSGAASPADPAPHGATLGQRLLGSGSTLPAPQKGTLFLTGK